MKTNIYFVKHAESESNINPAFNGSVDGLTEKGIKQSKRVANYFKDKNISNIFSSDILRAELTAREIAGSFNKKVIILHYLKERGVIGNNPHKHIYTEDALSFKKRLVQTKEYLQNLPQGNFVVVSHAIFLKSLIFYLLLEDLFNEEISNQISNRLIIENTTISKFMFNKEKNK